MKQKYGYGFFPNYILHLAQSSLSTAKEGPPNMSGPLSLRNVFWLPQLRQGGRNAGVFSAQGHRDTSEGRGRERPQELKADGWDWLVPMACLFFVVLNPTDILFFIIFLFHYGLLQYTEYSSLCSTVGPCCLSILYIIVCICWPQTPNPSLPQSPPPWQPPVCSLCLSLFLFHR